MAIFTPLIEQGYWKMRADLIVMGTHERTGLSHVLLGSVAEKLVRTAPCPEFTVRTSTAVSP
ncbi:MAG: universal stress protein [Nitrospinae bacterium]|nr:universal stress protein [Nitrospinota bacterium]